MLHCSLQHIMSFYEQEKAVISLTKNKALVDLYHRSLVKKEGEWREKLDKSLSRERMCEQVRTVSC